MDNNNDRIDKIISMLQELKKKDKKSRIWYISFNDNDIWFNGLGGINVTTVPINEELQRDYLDMFEFNEKVEIYTGSDTPLANVRRLLNYFLIKGYQLQIPDPDGLATKCFMMVKKSVGNNI